MRKNSLEFRALLLSICIHAILFVLLVFYLLIFKPSNLQNAIGFALTWSDNSNALNSPNNSSGLEGLSREPEVYRSRSLTGKMVEFKEMLSQVANHTSKSSLNKKVDLVLVKDVDKDIGNAVKNIDRTDKYFRLLTDQYKGTDLDYHLAVVEFQKVGNGNNIRVHSVAQKPLLIQNWLKSIPKDKLISPNDLKTVMSAIDRINYRASADKHLLLMSDEFDSSDGKLSEAPKAVKGMKSEEQVIKIISASKRKGIKIDAFGLNSPTYKRIAQETGGAWIPIESVNSERKSFKIRKSSDMQASAWGQVKTTLLRAEGGIKNKD